MFFIHFFLLANYKFQHKFIGIQIIYRQIVQNFELNLLLSHNTDIIHHTICRNSIV